MNYISRGTAQADSDISDIWLIGCSRSSLIAMPKEDTKSRRRFWRSRVGPEIPNILRQDMSIGPIPEISEPSDAEICGAFSDPFWNDPATGKVHTKPVGEFREIIVQGWNVGIDKIALFDSLASLTFDRRISDDVHLSVYGLNGSFSPESEAPFSDWPTIGDLRKHRMDVRKRLRFVLTRNTMPLIMSSMFAISRNPKFKYPPIWGNAADIQYLYRAREGKGYGSALERYTGASLGTISPMLCSYKKDQESKELIGFLLAEGEMILDAMHPSARDPKFFDRFEEWVRDWPESRESAYGWIRTWAGRLKRLQARRKKDGLLIRKRLDPLVDTYESHAWDLLTLFPSEPAFKQAIYLDVIGVLSHALAPEFHMRTDALRHHVGMSLYERRFRHETAEPDSDPDPVILGRIRSVSSSILRNYVNLPRFKQGGPVLTGAKQALLDDLPGIWQAGIQHTLDAFRNGARSAFALMGDHGEQPKGTDAHLAEFLRKVPSFFDRPEKIDWDSGRAAYRVIVDVGGLDPFDAASRLAFIRGKFAAWYALTTVHEKDIASGLMTGEMLLNGTIREVRL